MLSQTDQEAIIIVGIVVGVVLLLVGYYFYRRSKASAESALLLPDGDVVVVSNTSIGTDSEATKSGVSKGSNFKVKKRLGDGAYGTVYLATRRRDHQLVALKVIPCKDEKEAKESLKEYSMCLEVQGHSGIVKVYDVFFDVPVVGGGGSNNEKGNGRGNATTTAATVVGQSTANHSSPTNFEDNTAVLQQLGIRCPVAEKYLCIVSEYCQEGTLFDLLLTIRNANSHGRRERRIAAGLDEPIVWNYTLQLLEAIAFLHSKSLMHRDLKPSNVLLADNHRRLLLTDFGLSRIVEADEYAQTRTGTLQYMSPEQVQRRYNNKGDVWGVGCLVHSMCTAKVSTSEARIMFRDRAKPTFEATLRDDEMVGYSDDLISFLLQLLSYRYQERPSAPEAVQMCRDAMIRRGISLSPVH